MSARTLNVYVDRTLIGSLSEESNLWVFEYDPSWAKGSKSYDLSPALPRTTLRHADGGSDRPVQWFFDNLLPEELLRRAVAKEAGIKDDEDAFALLTYLGAESAGALTLLPPDVPLPTEVALSELPDEDLSARIRNLPQQTLTKNAPKRMSVAGAQHKMLVVLKRGTMFEPVGATPSTYILKPDHPDTDTYPASAFNEFLTMRLAAAARLTVPAVELRYVPEPVYLIERFDRVVDAGSLLSPDRLAPPIVNRVHIIDACQLLNKDRTFKHTGATLDALNKIVERTTNKLATRTGLFRWLVFNILVGNDDCHLKNISFHVREDGVWLAPHYDLLCTASYCTRAFAEDRASWSQVPMAFALPGAVTFGEVTLEAILAAAAHLGLPKPTAQRIVKEVTSRVEREFAAISRRHEEMAENPPPNRSPYTAVEARLLRVMQHIVLKDMLERLLPT